MNDKEKKAWEKRFDERFDSPMIFCSCVEGDMYNAFPEGIRDLKSFISQELETACKERDEMWRERIRNAPTFYGNPREDKMVYLQDLLNEQ